MTKELLDQLPVVDVHTHLDQARAISVANVDRFSTPDISIAMYRQGAQKLIHRLLGIAEDDRKFEQLAFKDKLQLAQFFTDRAYGKADNSLAQAALLFKQGQGEGARAGMGDQIEAIEQRAQTKYPEFSRSRRAIRESSDGNSGGSHNDDSCPTDGASAQESKVTPLRRAVR